MKFAPGLGLAILLASHAAAEELVTTVELTTETQYVCIDSSLDQSMFGNNSRQTTRERCIALSQDKPGVDFLVRFTERVVSKVKIPLEKWVVAPGPRTDRTMYECNRRCIRRQVRGVRMAARSDNTRVGICEGPLSPVWASNNQGQQWQFHTNAAGQRGLVRCAYMVPRTNVPNLKASALEPGDPVNCPLFVFWKDVPEGARPRVYVNDIAVDVPPTGRACIKGEIERLLPPYRIQMTSFTPTQESERSDVVEITP